MKKIVIVGAGSAGISVAARLLHSDKDFEVSIIDPADVHYYQPYWTLVGAGVGTREQTARKMIDVIPHGAKWIQDKVVSFRPEENKIQLETAPEPLDYDYLVVCPGIQLDWNKVEGLKETMGKNGVCSNYSYETVNSTYEALKNCKKGNAIFTFPATPIKCGGAPQKIMWLAEHYFEKKGIRSNMKVEFCAPGAAIFGVEKYKNALEKLVAKRDIKTTFHVNLVKIDGPARKAWFKNVESAEVIEKEFEMIHVTPPQSAPDFIKTSPLADAAGWIDVDKYSLQHTKYPNIFALGDATNTPNAKTGAAIRKQAPICTANLIAHSEGKKMPQKYNGYASCPIVTGYGRLILAEFDYDGRPVETFPFDQSKERYSMWFLKKYILPPLYWLGMLKGRV